MRLQRVVLPEPDGPTRAMVWPGSAVRVMPERTSGSSVVGLGSSAVSSSDSRGLVVLLRG